MLTLNSKPRLLSAAELRFFHALKKAVGRKHYIGVKVRIADLIDYSPAAWKAHGRATSSLHIDFVLLNSKDTAIIVCIELDDQSHATDKGYERDKVKTRILFEAGIPLIRFPARRAYDARAISKTIKEALRAIKKT